jgi:hypothetical protein
MLVYNNDRGERLEECKAAVDVNMEWENPEAIIPMQSKRCFLVYFSPTA